MTLPENADLRPVAMSVLTRRAGSAADAAAVAAAARRAYDDLAVVAVPLIGQVGVDALTARASHLAQRQYSWGQTGEKQGAGPFGPVGLWLERQDPSVAIGAAAEMLSTLGGLLVTFIGQPLTMRLLRKAWPDGFPETSSKETST